MLPGLRSGLHLPTLRMLRGLVERAVRENSSRTAFFVALTVTLLGYHDGMEKRPYQPDLENGLVAAACILVVCVAWVIDLDYLPPMETTRHGGFVFMAVITMRFAPLAGVVGALFGRALASVEIALLIWVLLWLALFLLIRSSGAWSV